jgi:hypothetical protein
MSRQVPQIGDTVHYVTSRGCRAAIVTDVVERPVHEEPGTTVLQVGLYIIEPSSTYFARNVSPDPTGKHLSTWHWPESAAKAKAKQ